MIDTMSYLSAYGHSQIFIARAVGLSPKYLSDLKHTNPDVKEALSKSQEHLLSDVRANMHRIAIDGDDKHATSVGFKLLERYEDDEPSDVVTVSDEAIAKEILDELT